MSIGRLKSGKYQVRCVGNDGRSITKAFLSKRDAEVYETDLKRIPANKLQIEQSTSLLMNTLCSGLKLAKIKRHQDGEMHNCIFTEIISATFLEA